MNRTSVTNVAAAVILGAATLGIATSADAAKAASSSAIIREHSEIARLYDGHTAPLWTGSPAAEARAIMALTALSNSDLEGLDPADYAISASDVSVIGFEQALSSAFLSYMHDVRDGRVLPRHRGTVLLPASDFDAVEALRTAVEEDRLSQLMAELPPPREEYAVLRDALQHYRNLASGGGWPLLEGEWDARTSRDSAAFDALRNRLSVEDALVETAGAAGNTDLLAAVLRYQRRNGLEPDGIAGPQTLAMLNMTAEGRAEQIMANMERWRWLPRATEPRRVEVNVPDASLEAWSSGKSALHSRVIVGAPATPTPIMRTLVTGVTLHPEWTVPMSIAAGEILPHLQNDPAYMQRHDMAILDGDPTDPSGLSIGWNAISADSFPYRLRQAPGPNNPLGAAKLEMSNPFSVFLHDTPGKQLFARNDRALSHGCVRVDDILSLASFALSGDAEAFMQDLEARLSTPETQHLPLAEPLAVYILYFTALPADDGGVAFRPDVYHRDGDLYARMSGS